MPCYYPVPAYRLDDGSIVFDEVRHGAHVTQWLHVPCGQCDGCRLERARQWAVRCMHEASLHEHNSFITLTYDDTHVPDDLDYEHFQLFMKRLRKRFSKQSIRFFMCGEYGDLHDRPHFHACLFGFDFADKVYFRTTSSGSKIYTSRTLDSLWSDKGGGSIGFATVGSVTFDSAGYVARYSLKKGVGRGSDLDYEYIDYETGEVLRRSKEFVHMSLKPGIGKGFYDKWKSDLFPRDQCVINGVATKPPQYYYKKLREEDPESHEDIGWRRAERALEKKADNTQERLEVKEKVLKAKIKFLRRDLK